jgi:triphosphatase
METTYYDTFDGKLFNRRWTLRRRLENEVSVCTLKIPLDDGSRGEWEVEAAGLITGIPKLCKLGAPMDLMALTVNGIVPVCGARFTRLAKTLQLEDCTVELALDQGVLTGRGKEQPLCEVEVELKDGSEEVAVRFAKTLSKEFSLSEEPDSKYRRALILAYT